MISFDPSHKIKVTKPLVSIKEKFNDSDNNASDPPSSNGGGHHDNSGSKSGSAEEYRDPILGYLDEEEMPVTVEEVKEDVFMNKNMVPQYYPGPPLQ